MPKSKTKAYRTAKWALRGASFLLNAGPVVCYVIAGAATSDLAREKLTLSLTIVAVAIMSIVAAVNRIAMRSRIWVVLIGIYVCLGEILVPLMVIGFTQILDEVVVGPLARHFSQKALISAEIDRRL